LIHESIHGDGTAIDGELDLWVRDPVECIRDLIGNPEFKDDIKYAPERIWVAGRRMTTEGLGQATRVANGNGPDLVVYDVGIRTRYVQRRI
jgi:hypothetical protein